MKKIFNNGHVFAESLREAMQETTDLESYAGDTVYTQDDDRESNFSKLKAKAIKLMAEYVATKTMTTEDIDQLNKYCFVQKESGEN